MKMLQRVTLGQAGLVARKLARPVGVAVFSTADEGVRAPGAGEADKSVRAPVEADEGIRAPAPIPGLQPGYMAGYDLEERLWAPLLMAKEKAQIAAERGGR